MPKSSHLLSTPLILLGRREPGANPRRPRHKAGDPGQDASLLQSTITNKYMAWLKDANQPTTTGEKYLEETPEAQEEQIHDR